VNVLKLSDGFIIVLVHEFQTVAGTMECARCDVSTSLGHLSTSYRYLCFVVTQIWRAYHLCHILKHIISDVKLVDIMTKMIKR
jgi:hypothetical protein